jgi:26S proteasome regulatory subunit N8
MKRLDARLREIWWHFDLVIEGKLPLNHEILYFVPLAGFAFPTES